MRGTADSRSGACRHRSRRRAGTISLRSAGAFLCLSLPCWISGCRIWLGCAEPFKPFFDYPELLGVDTEDAGPPSLLMNKQPGPLKNSQVSARSRPRVLEPLIDFAGSHGSPAKLHD